MSVEDLRDDFSFLADWEERFRYIVELGRELEPMPEADKTEEHRVLGCQSRVWITVNCVTPIRPHCTSWATATRSWSRG